MLDHSSKDLGAGDDPLTEILRGLRLDGVEYGRCELTEPWGLSFPALQAARFHFIGRRGCWLLTPCKAWMKLEPGDAVLLPRGGEHALASAPGVPMRPLESYAIRPLCENVYRLRCEGGGEGGGEGDGATTLLFCGSMRFNLDSLHPLLALMPEVMRFCDLAVSEPGIPHLLEAMSREVTMERVGSGGMLARLADVVAASIIRSWVEGGCGDATGWLAAVRDPKIGRVLAAIHLEPSRPWTVGALAGLMGASRSGFAQHFTTIVGETPARYVTRVRMHQARQWLERDRLRIAAVASRLGYDSEASFSRAFKRVLGAPPSRFRVARETGRRDDGPRVTEATHASGAAAAR